MSKPLAIALVRANLHDEITGARTFEDDVLLAALGVPTPHRLIVYPGSPRMEQAARDLGVAQRVSFLPPIKQLSLPERVLRRSARTLARQARPKPYAELTVALEAAGAQCAWMLGATLVPLDIPYVATIWDLQHRVQPWFPEVSSDGEWRVREALYREYVQRAAAIVVGTQRGAHEVASCYGNITAATHVIPMPTPSFATDAGLRAREGRPAGLPARFLLYPAQLWAHKNHVTAVRVIAGLGNESDAPHLVCIGADGGTLSHVMNVARSLGVADRVHHYGFVDRPRLIALYEHAEALLYPSLFGPDNLPPLEAMALGCPVIAARVPGSEEQIGDAGLLIDGFDVAGFANAVRTLRADPVARATMVERGYARARAWTPAQYAGAVLSLIEARVAPFRALWA